MSSSVLKKICAHAPNILLWGTIYRARKQSCSNTLGRNELKVFISSMENKLACFANTQGSFQVPQVSLNKVLHTKNYALDFTILTALD